MAINVYLTLFKKYNATQLKALEWKYHLMCYGAPFVAAFIYLFVSTESRGKIYGSAAVCIPQSKDPQEQWIMIRYSYGVGYPVNGTF